MAYAPVAIGLTTFRRRGRTSPPWLAVVIASGAPLAVAAALPPRSRARYAAAGMAYMWLFVSWELPADDEGTHRRRLNIDYPIRFDSALCGGVPPGLRLQRAAHEGRGVAAGRRGEHHRLVVSAPRPARLRRCCATRSTSRARRAGSPPPTT